jgi:hypothetical protein
VDVVEVVMVRIVGVRVDDEVVDGELDDPPFPGERRADSLPGC